MRESLPPHHPAFLRAWVTMASESFRASKCPFYVAVAWYPRKELGMHWRATANDRAQGLIEEVASYSINQASASAGCFIRQQMRASRIFSESRFGQKQSEHQCANRICDDFLELDGDKSTNVRSERARLRSARTSPRKRSRTRAVLTWISALSSARYSNSAFMKSVH